MQEVLLTRRSLDYSAFVKHGAREADFDQLLNGDVVGIDKDTKQIIFVQKQLPFDAAQVVAALDKIKYEENTRTSGLRTRSRIFGYNPRNTIRKDFCSATSLAIKQPAEHAAIVKYGIKIAQLYSEYTPEVYQAHVKLLKEKVLNEWQIKDTPFTSGIINKNNPLKYHFDSGNFKKVYSCMAVFKKETRGGYLALPEYGVGLTLPHNSVFMFDGQSVLHGVTPITKTTPEAVRYSIVYYSLQQIWNCLPLSEEIARIRNIKTNRERRRAYGEVHETFSRNT